MKILKGQGLVEFGLILAFVAVIGVVLFSPIGTNIKNALINASPKTAESTFNPTVNGITGSSEATAELNTNIDALASSTSSASQSAAQFIKDTLEIASMVNENKNTDISDDAVQIIATSYKKNNMAETSGSLAQIIATNIDMSTVDGDDLSVLNSILSEVEEAKVSIDETDTSVMTASEELLALLASLDEDAKKELFSYDLSPVDVSNPADIAGAIDVYYKSDASGESIGNIVNTALLVGNILKSETASAELKAKAAAFNESFKKALSFS